MAIASSSSKPGYYEGSKSEPTNCNFKDVPSLKLTSPLFKKAGPQNSSEPTIDFRGLYMLVSMESIFCCS